MLPSLGRQWHKQNIKLISLNNEAGLARSTVIILDHSKSVNYTFTVNLGWCGERCTILYDLSDRLCVPNNTEDATLKVFKMVTRIS